MTPTQSTLKKALSLNRYFGTPFTPPPSVKTMTRWSNDSIARSVTGKRVEPDGVGPDGSPSWMVVLGII